MRIVLAAVTTRRQGLRPGPARELFQLFVDRIAHYAGVELIFAETEAALFERIQHEQGRVPSKLVLLDSRGRGLTSEAFAERIRTMRDAGAQQMVFAIGPAGGWTDVARANADWMLSLGALTLPHELALVVLSEQLYRAHTILAGHPYHCGH